jgi:spermidine synthase
MVFFAGILFFLSGAATLAYEVVWVKLLTLQFGSAAWSISTVVASFMAGLGAGGAWAGRRADRIRRPLRAYALLELGIALFGVVSVPLLRNMAGVLDPLYHLTDGYFSLFVLLQFLLSFAMLAVPTFLMGASLPLLIVAVTEEAAFRRSVALFYGINTLGAAAGTLVAGLVLMPVLGISDTVWIAVAAGVLVAAGGYLLDLRMGPREVSEEYRRPAASTRTPRLLLAAVAMAGCLGLFYQIAWTRLLIPVVGSSVYAFTIILTTVLLGIGVGSLLAAVPSFRESSCWRAVAVALGVGSCSALAGLFAVNELPGMFTAMAQGTGDRTWLLFLSQGVLAASIVLVPACAMGAVLPLGIAAWRSEVGSRGWAVGGMYAANTIGAIVGSVLAGFAFLPWLGATGSIRLGATLGMVVTVVLFLLDRTSAQRQRLGWAGLCAAMLAAFAFALPQIDVKNLQQGVFRRLQANEEHSPLGNFLLYTREGTNATVTVFRTRNSTVLKVNGKADASTGEDMDSQYLLGHLPMFLHPGPQEVCIIGYGSGATVYATATHPNVTAVDVVEIEQAVLDASEYFNSVNHGILEDSRVRLYTEDGRNFLRHQKKTYDVILSQPSNPWIAGISSLFTTEYYRAASARLKPGGLFCQWMQAYETSAETVRVVLHTLASEFPYVAVFKVSDDLICVASHSPIAGSARRYAEHFSLPKVRNSLRRIQIETPFDLFAGAFLRFPENADAFESPIKNTDDNLWLEYRAPIEMYQGTQESVASILSTDYLRMLQHLFPELALRDIVLGTAQSIATRHSNLWYVIPAWQEMFAEDESLAMRLAELSALADSRKRALDGNEAREKAALRLIQEQRYAEAIPLFEAVLAAEPASVSAHRMLAWALSHTGDNKRAWRHYVKAVQYNPDDFESYTNMAAIALSNGLAEGTELLDRALTANPYHFTAWRVYVEYLVDQKQYDQARELLRKAGESIAGEKLETLKGMIPG